MKREFPIRDTWLPFEIHPETPPEGIALTKRFPGMDPSRMVEQFNERGKELGVRFGPWERLSNSRQALEAGEFAKDQGLAEEMHEAIFAAHFSRSLDIGRRELLLEIAENVGLDPEALDRALDRGTYRPRLEETTRRAHEKGIRAAPTFEIEGGQRVVGAVPLETLRTAIQEARKPGKSSSGTPREMLTHP